MVCTIISYRLVLLSEVQVIHSLTPAPLLPMLALLLPAATFAASFKTSKKQKDEY